MKAQNLKILKENGINVPDFDVIEWDNRYEKIDYKKYHGKYAHR